MSQNELPLRVTIVDVARRAGVSTATVSRVVNRAGNVHAQTEARVRELGYREAGYCHALADHPSRRRRSCCGEISTKRLPSSR